MSGCVGTSHNHFNYCYRTTFLHGFFRSIDFNLRHFRRLVLVMHMSSHFRCGVVVSTMQGRSRDQICIQKRSICPGMSNPMVSSYHCRHTVQCTNPITAEISKQSLCLEVFLCPILPLGLPSLCPSLYTTGCGQSRMAHKRQPNRNSQCSNIANHKLVSTTGTVRQGD